MKTITLAIDGMTCGHCVGAVRSALASVDGLAIDQVAVGSATVQVPDAEGESGPTVAAAIAAIDDAGYTARVGTPAPAGAPSLHSLGRHHG